MAQRGACEYRKSYAYAWDKWNIKKWNEEIRDDSWQRYWICSSLNVFERCHQTKFPFWWRQGWCDWTDNTTYSNEIFVMYFCSCNMDNLAECLQMFWNTLRGKGWTIVEVYFWGVTPKSHHVDSKVVSAASVTWMESDDWNYMQM